MSVQPLASPSGSTLPRLPFELRSSQVQYTNADGSVGATAVPINYDELYNLKGRLLTLVDATFTDPQQRKAQKDLVWAAVRAWYDDLERNATWQPADGDDTAKSEQNAYLAHKGAAVL
jgi:hypothetical protein